MERKSGLASGAEIVDRKKGKAVGSNEFQSALQFCTASMLFSIIYVIGCSYTITAIDGKLMVFETGDSATAERRPYFDAGMHASCRPKRKNPSSVDVCKRYDAS